MRSSYIGGSDIGALLGLDPWKTPLEVYYRKTEPNKIEHGFSAKAEIGIHIESFIADCYKRKTDSFAVLEVPEKITHPKYDFLGGHIDRMVHSSEDSGPDRVLECKNTGGYGSKLLWDDGVPAYYFAQVQFYLMLTGLKYADVAVLKDGWDFSIVEIEREEDFIEVIEQTAIEFWQNNVLANKAPEAINEGDFKLLYPTSKVGKQVTADSEIALACEELSNLKLKLKDLEKQEGQLEFKIKEYLQDSESLLIDGKPVVTFKNNKDSVSYDWKRFASDNPSLLQDYKITKPGARPFVFKR